MGSRGGGRRKQQQEMMKWYQQQQQQQQQTLTPLMEGPDAQLEFQLHNYDLWGGKYKKENTGGSNWELVREWFRLQKNTLPPAAADQGGGGLPSSKRGQDLRLILGVLACPLAPIPLDIFDHNSPDYYTNNNPQLFTQPLHHIQDLPIESSTAHYIIQQYLAATGCLKKQQQCTTRKKNMYVAGAVRMICCETEISSGKSVKTVGSRSGENGCFVMWQMSPGMWSLELAVGGHKVLAGSDGKIVWRHTPWLGSHAAKGPHRPLRRLIQGLDPKSTARLFGRAQCMGEKRIGEDDCFVLKVSADRAAVMERSEGPAEVIRHVLYGYFCQKSGLLIYMEDSHLTRVVHSQSPSPSPSPSPSQDGGDDDTVYWETTIGSSIGDYRDVDGLMIAHQGRTIATVFRFGEMSMQHTRTRMEEHWCIDDVVFDVPGLSVDSFIPPADIIFDSPSH